MHCLVLFVEQTVELCFAQKSNSTTRVTETDVARKIFEYNGSDLVATVGKNCFAIGSDHRLGVNLQTIAADFQGIFKIHDKLYVGPSGLATDAQTLYQRLIFRHKLYQLREERGMKPQTCASLVSALLYEKRFGPYFCRPVIAGLQDDCVPFICTMDRLGAKEPEELFENFSTIICASGLLEWLGRSCPSCDTK